MFLVDFVMSSPAGQLHPLLHTTQSRRYGNWRSKYYSSLNSKRAHLFVNYGRTTDIDCGWSQEVVIRKENIDSEKMEDGLKIDITKQTDNILTTNLSSATCLYHHQVDHK